MNSRIKVMRIEVPQLCLIIATLALGSASCGSTCVRGESWWDRQRGACIACTRCDPARRLAVKYPCELHRNTICQSVYDVKIWPFNTPKRNSTKDSRDITDYEYYDYVDYNDSELSESDVIKWDLETSTLMLAVSGCVVFFVVVLSLSLYHAKQWKVIKRALKSDVQDLSAKLRLMEAGVETPVERVAPTDYHLYCNIHVGKDGLIGPSLTKGFGNVYTQDKH